MLRTLVGLEELVAGDTGLHEGCAKSGTLQVPVAWKRKRTATSVGVAPRESYVVLLADDMKAEDRERCDDPLARRIDRELCHSDGHAGLGDEGLDDRVVLLELGRTESLNVERNG